MSIDEADLSPAPGFVDPEVSAEFPGLRLDWITVPGRRGPSPPALRRRLASLSSRYRGASVVAMRTQPVPHAYRAFFRQIGLDPDVDRVPSEQAALSRLLHGGFRSKGPVEDALLLALIETGVPVWALDAEGVDVGGLGIRLAREDEEVSEEGTGGGVPAGRLVVADTEHIHAVLFGEILPGRGVGARTERMTLFAVGVDGVPAIHVEEALWTCREALSA